MRRLALLFALLVSGCFFGYRHEDPSHPVPRVHRGTFADDMVLTGQLDAARGSTIAVPPLPGPTSIRWIAEDGVEVKEGDKVVELDTGPYTGDLDTKRQAVEQARQQLTEKDAEAAADIAQKALDLEQKQTDFDKAVIDATVPRDIVSKRDFEEREIKRKRAEVELAKAKDVLRGGRATVAADRANLVLALEKAEREMSMADEAMKAVTLHAPRNGIVVIRDNIFGEARKLQAGDGAFVGMILALIPEPESLQVDAALADVDDGQVAAGMPVTVILDAYSDMRTAGHVESISAVAQESARASLRRAFNVVVKLDTIDRARMRVGLSARVIVHRALQKDVLLAPRASLDLSGKEARARLADGHVSVVSLGACNAQECVVTGGLHEGEDLR
jgi:multidrug resistance efflux pump